jgi:hypothetical protein
MSISNLRLSAADSKAGRLQRACLERMREHERTGALPTSNRFVYYELMRLGIVEKKPPKIGSGGRRSDQDVVDDNAKRRRPEHHAPVSASPA